MKDLFEEEMKKATNYIEAFPWGNKDFYLWYLSQTYYFVCHSTRLLGLGASFLTVKDESHYQRFLEHMKEENRHEKLAEADIEFLGSTLSDFEELPITKAFYQSQYFKIGRSSALDFYGYILFLEGVAIHAFPKVYELLEGQYGKRACHFLRVHVEEDPDHVDKALKAIGDLNKGDEEKVRENFIETSNLYQLILRECLEKSKSS